MTKMGIEVPKKEIKSGSLAKTSSKKKQTVKISPIRLVNEIGV